MTDNATLENVPLSLELVRISNHTFKGMIEANCWKNRNKLFHSSEVNHVVWCVETRHTLSQTFPKFELLFSLYQLFFKFNNSLAPQFSCIAKTYRKQVCFCIYYLAFSFSHKIKYCSLLCRSSSSSFGLP